MKSICKESEEAIEKGYSFIVLSDKKLIKKYCIKLSSCLFFSTSSFSQNEENLTGIIIETGEAREVHHHCLLVGYGADAINPYLAFTVLRKFSETGYLKIILNLPQI